MIRKTATALVARKKTVKRAGLTHEDLYHINVVLGRKLMAGFINDDLVLYCHETAAERRLLSFGAIATEFREQKIDLVLHKIEPIEIRRGFDPVVA